MGVFYICILGLHAKRSREIYPTIESNLKNRLAHLGKKTSEETKKRQSLAYEKNKELHIARLKGNKYALGHKMSEESKRRMIIKKTGQKHSEETKIKMSLARKGRVCSEETRRKISLTNTGNKWSLSGEKCNFWKGGITKKNMKIRSSSQMIRWRKSVFERDNYTCQICKKQGVTLNADHIKPFAYYPELRFELSNGRTLCISCHKQTDTYMGKAKKYAIIEV